MNFFDLNSASAIPRILTKYAFRHCSLTAGTWLHKTSKRRTERESSDERVEQVPSMSKDSVSLVGAAGGTGVGQAHAASAVK